MNDYAVVGLIIVGALAALAISGLGIRVAINAKAKKNVKNNLRDVKIGGDFVGRDKSR